MKEVKRSNILLKKTHHYPSGINTIIPTKGDNHHLVFLWG